MKTLILASLIAIASTVSAQTTLVSTNAPQLQEIERSAVAWKSAIASEEAEYARIEADSSKVFVIEKVAFGDFSGKKAKYGSKQDKLNSVGKSIASLKRARDKEMSAMCADLK
jgi:hypothetical protein